MAHKSCREVQRCGQSHSFPRTGSQVEGGGSSLLPDRCWLCSEWQPALCSFSIQLTSTAQAAQSSANGAKCTSAHYLETLMSGLPALAAVLSVCQDQEGRYYCHSQGHPSGSQCSRKAHVVSCSSTGIQREQA